jgi:RNA 2',3'-cyclic 3'-phosphodiesterase
MSGIRTFIAIPLPRTIQQKLDETVRSLRDEKSRAVRWVAARNIHLTLKFIGEVDGAKIDAIGQVIQAESRKRAPFEVSAGGAGAFPNLRRPRVIWIGVQAPADLAELANAIDQGLQKLGFAGEVRPFSPHLTLGRVSENASLQEVQSLSQALAAAKVGNLGSFSVSQVILFRSDLQPSGPVYTPLISAKMAESGDVNED